MALAFPHVKFMFELRKAGILNGAYDLMEFGEQNWYGDVGLDAIIESANAYLSPEDAAVITEEVKAEAEKSQAGPEAHQAAIFKLAEIFYRTIFTINSHEAVDLHGTSRAHKHDLNFPVPIEKKSTLVINFGTGEHVFNQYSFFKNLHDLCAVDGLMLHSMPNQGCFDHGFFNYHPTFIFDLAQANNYKIESVIYADMTQKPANMMLIDRASYVNLAVNKLLSPYSALLSCLRKTSDAAFVIPQQGYYNDTLPPELQAAWSNLDR